jgi:hydrogenase nickel incorporation protein HypA/HybF
MHEMPYTQAILETALLAAGGRPVRCIRLRVGWLAAIVPQSVEVFFDLLSRGTPAQGAALRFEIAPIRLACRNCGAELALHPDPRRTPRQALAEALRAGCTCGRGELTLAGGLGCEVDGIEVDAEPPGADRPGGGRSTAPPTPCSPGRG